jgi:hypothetical protein
MAYPLSPASNLKEWFQQLLDQGIFRNLNAIEELDVSSTYFIKEYEQSELYKLEFRSNFLVDRVYYYSLIEYYLAYREQKITLEECNKRIDCTADRFNRLWRTSFTDINSIVDYLLDNKITTIELINEYAEILKQFPYITTPYDLYDEYVKNLLGLKELKLVAQHGGEGEGDNYWFVYYYKPTKEYIRFRGYYTSYDGRDIDTMELVEPVEVIVTEYRSI